MNNAVVLQLLVTANVPSLPIFVTMMTEAFLQNVGSYKSHVA
jgi:hypothetical protein